MKISRRSFLKLPFVAPLLGLIKLTPPPRSGQHRAAAIKVKPTPEKWVPNNYVTIAEVIEVAPDHSGRIKVITGSGDGGARHKEIRWLDPAVRFQARSRNEEWKCLPATPEVGTLVMRIPGDRYIAAACFEQEGVIPLVQVDYFGNGFVNTSRGPLDANTGHIIGVQGSEGPLGAQGSPGPNHHEA